VGANTLLYNTAKVGTAPKLSALYDAKYKARSPFPTTRSRSRTPRCTSPRRSRRSGSRPYALDDKQLTAAADLLKRQRPLIRKYWSLASDEIDLFKNGDAVVGASWPYQTITLQARRSRSRT